MHRGTITLNSLGSSLTLERGESAFIAANEPMVTADGHGDLFVARPSGLAPSGLAPAGLAPTPSLA